MADLHRSQNDEHDYGTKGHELLVVLQYEANACSTYVAALYPIIVGEMMPDEHASAQFRQWTPDVQ
jgi:hypothetical protein